MSKLRFKLAVLFLFIGINYVMSSEISSDIIITEKSTKGAIPIVTSSSVIQILIDKQDAKVVEIAAKLLADDIKRVTGQSTEVINSLEESSSENLIICGTLGQSFIIDKMVDAKKLDVSQIKSKWEASVMKTIKKPYPKIKNAIVIAGSDRRGTAYGMMDISRAMGVSPWVWWADATPAPKKELYFQKVSRVEHGPSIKYRGIFINDEDWSLIPWIAETFDPELGNIGPKTYTKIFELMLRLKSNYLWPAMHGCSLPFNHFPETSKIADQYAIVIGASHCEPMLRNNVSEWAKDGREKWQWDYFKFPEMILNYWEEILSTRGKYENLYTVGMRGIHDGSMPGSKIRSERVAKMEQIFEDQKDLIEKYSDKKAEDIPMIFCPYKEVLYDYDAGMKVPEDITICWAEDNQGYVRRMPNQKERARSGGHGIYYHLSYWSDYLWQVTIAPQLIAQQMVRAYDFDIKKLWVVNVGDIVAAERETQFMMDLGWDIDRGRNGQAHQWLEQWASETFGKQYAKEIAFLLNEYYRLAWRGKPEHIGHTVYNKAELEQRMADYKNIAEKSEILRAKLPQRLDVAYFHLVHYPVVAVGAHNHKILLARRSAIESQDGEISKSKESLKMANEAFEKVKLLTVEYNELGDGKWNHIMDYKPRNIKVLKEPIPDIGLVYKDALDPQPIPLDKAVVIAPWTYENGVLSASLDNVREPENFGSATFTFNAKHDGFIQIYVCTKSEQANSIFAKLDDGKWITCHIKNTANKWRWVTLDSFKFKQGENTITFSQREPDVQIKEIRTTRKTTKSVPHATSLAQYNDLMRVPDTILTLNNTYDVSQGDGNTTISIEQGLSIDGYGAFLLPHRAKSYESPSDAPALQFKVNIKPGTYKARVKFLPSRPTTSNDDMRCAFAANGSNDVVKNVKELKETYHNHHSCTWTTTLTSEASLDGYLYKDFEFKTDGTTKLSVKMLDTGMIFYRIEIFKNTKKE